MQTLITPEEILKLVLELERHVSQLDVFRMNKVWLRDVILDLLSEESINKINEFNDPKLNEAIINSVLITIKPLSSDYIQQVLKRLYLLSGDENIQVQVIKKFEYNLKRKQKTEKYSIVGIILLTILLCLLIWYGGS